jgi:hypothetical protein
MPLAADLNVTVQDDGRAALAGPFFGSMSGLSGD